MEMQELEIIIGRDGQVAISVRGARGPACVGLTGALEEQLGELVERTHTAEFYSSFNEGMVRDSLAEKASVRRR